MASGQIFPLSPCPPATVFATLDTITGTSSPVEAVPVFDFDASATEYMDFYGVAEGYGGGGFTLKIKWSSSAAAGTGEVVWEAAFRRVADDAEDLDTTVHTYDYNTAADDTAPSAQGEVSYISITFTDGADSDSVADGEEFILRIRRKHDAAGDDMTGDAELHFNSLVLRET
jgi:hypothetical protein